MLRYILRPSHTGGIPSVSIRCFYFCKNTLGSIISSWGDEVFSAQKCPLLWEDKARPPALAGGPGQCDKQGPAPWSCLLSCLLLPTILLIHKARRSSGWFPLAVTATWKRWDKEALCCPSGVTFVGRQAVGSGPSILGTAPGRWEGTIRS